VEEAIPVNFGLSENFQKNFFSLAKKLSNNAKFGAKIPHFEKLGGGI